MSIFGFIQPFDEMCARWVTAFRMPALDHVMTVTARLGDFGGIWLITAIFLLTRIKWRNSGLRVIFCLALCFIITNIVLKNVVARPRPFETLPWITTLIAPPDDYSFPSGHTASAFAAAFALWRSFGWRFGVPAIVVAAIIAFARVYVGAHYVSDVAAGAVTGLISGYAGSKVPLDR